MRIVLGENREWKGAGSSRRSTVKKEEMMYVPLLDTLQSILSHEDTIEVIIYIHVGGSFEIEV